MVKRPLEKRSSRSVVRQRASGGPWPAWLQRTLAALEEIPWIQLTALAVLCGAALQFHYFKSIGHVPSELGALTALAVSTSAAVLVLLLSAAFFLAAPALVALSYSNESDTPPELWFT